MKNARLPVKAKSSAVPVVHRIKSMLQFVAALPPEFFLLVMMAVVCGVML